MDAKIMYVVLILCFAFKQVAHKNLYHNYIHQVGQVPSEAANAAGHNEIHALLFEWPKWSVAYNYCT